MGPSVQMVTLNYRFKIFAIFSYVAKIQYLSLSCYKNTNHLINHLLIIIFIHHIILIAHSRNFQENLRFRCMKML